MEHVWVPSGQRMDWSQHAESLGAGSSERVGGKEGEREKQNQKDSTHTHVCTHTQIAFEGGGGGAGRGQGLIVLGMCAAAGLFHRPQSSLMRLWPLLVGTLLPGLSFDKADGPSGSSYQVFLFSF